MKKFLDVYVKVFHFDAIYKAHFLETWIVSCA